MRRSLLSTALAAGTLLVAAASFAQEEGQDEVTLKNGGLIRGTVVASEPGTSVKIIELGQKQVRVIPWAQVSDVERGKYAPKTNVQPGSAGPGYGAAPPPPGAVPPPAPELGAPGVVKVHVDSPVRVNLLEHASAFVGYGMALERVRPVCASPCDRVVDGSGGRRFSVAAEGLTPPSLFAFEGLSGDVTVRVSPGSSARRSAGMWLSILGGSAAGVGLLMIPLALWGGQTVGGGFKGQSTVAAAGVTAGVGVALLAAGIPLLVTAATKVRVEPREPRTGQLRPRLWMGEF